MNESCYYISFIRKGLLKPWQLNQWKAILLYPCFDIKTHTFCVEWLKKAISFNTVLL